MKYESNAKLANRKFSYPCLENTLCAVLLVSSFSWSSGESPFSSVLFLTAASLITEPFSLRPFAFSLAFTPFLWAIAAFAWLFPFCTFLLDSSMFLSSMTSVCPFLPTFGNYSILMAIWHSKSVSNTPLPFHIKRKI